MTTNRRAALLLALFVACLTSARLATALPVVGPGETFLCTRNFSTPIFEGQSVGVVPLELRARAVGQIGVTDQQIAWQSFGFVPLADGEVTITVPSIVFQGLLDAHFAGTANRAEVRVLAALREIGDDTNLDIDVVHERLHTSGGPVGDDNLFAPVDAVLQHEVERGTNYAVMVRLEVEARGFDAQADYLTGAEEGVGGRRVSFACLKIEADMLDTDEDGIPDQIEDSGLPGLDLPAMGATSDHKDIFLEIDWLSGRQPTQAAVRAVRDAFAASPVANPDLDDGIRLHVDAGDLTDPAASEDDAGPGTCNDGVNNDPEEDNLADEDDPDCLVGDLVFSDLDGGQDLGDGSLIPAGDIPTGAGIPDLETDLDGNDRADFLDVRVVNFDIENRLGIFHYALSAENLTVGGGQAELGGGNIILGTTRASTLMHELGHNLGLEHGGDEGDLEPEVNGDEGNCKPNYISIMNYQHSSNGGIPTRGMESGQDLDGNGEPDGKIVDFSPPRLAQEDQRGQAPLAPLNEGALDDDQVLDPTDPDNQFIFVDPNGVAVRRGLDEPADWNNADGEINPINVNTSDENGNPAACTNDRLDDELTGYNDWENVDLRIYGFGDAIAGMFNPTTWPEPTDEEIGAFILELNTADLGITKNHAPELAVAGQPITYLLTATNHGPNPARGVRVVDTLPPEVTVAELPPGCVEAPPGVVTCELGEIERGEIVEVELEGRVALGLPCEGAQRIFITNTAEVEHSAGPDPVGRNNRATDRSEVLCIRYEYAAKVLCGVQDDPEDLRLATGLYATSINVHNPNDGEIGFFKKLALAFPPAEQRAGRVVPIGVDTLGYDEALKADCNELAERLPAGVADQAPYFEGFLVIQSPLSLDVTGVYSTAALDADGGVRGHSSVDVEIIPERERRPSSDLSISKAATFQGQTAPHIQYTIKVTNDSLVAAEGIVVSDRLTMEAGDLTAVPENELAASHGGDWVVLSSDPSGADLEAQIPRLDPGETATLAFAVRTQTDIGAGRTHVFNVASVDSETPDADPSNNRATVETVIDLP